MLAYGNEGKGRVDFQLASRVYLVEDSTSLDVVLGWDCRAGRVMGLDTRAVSSVDLHYYDAYILPPDEATDAEVPAELTPLIVQGALIEAMEARQDTGVRGDEPWPNGFQQTTLLDRLVAKFELMKSELEMNLPVVQR